MIKKLSTILSAILLTACSSNNCPLESTVLCNYYFYDSEGTAIKYSDPFTVTTLLSGYKTVYTYRKLGSTTVTLSNPSSDLLDQGYTKTVSEVRRDTVLANKVTGRSYIQMPMSYFNHADTLIFNYNSIARNDTLIIQHDSYAHVELPECGTHYYHRLKSVKSTDAAIDRIEITNPLVDYEGKENIKIYFNGVVE